MPHPPFPSNPMNMQHRTTLHPLLCAGLTSEWSALRSTKWAPAASKRASVDNHPDRVLLSCGLTINNTRPCLFPLLSCSNFDNETETRIRDLAREPDVYERLVNSIAPSIYGSEDIKKAVACLLFGGESRGAPLLSPSLRLCLPLLKLAEPTQYGNLVLPRLHQNLGRWHAPAWRH
jgi:hypothetical protein